MASPLYNAMNPGGGQLPGRLGQAQKMMREFEAFKRDFRGDARQEVQRLLDSGQMTQEQYNQFARIAQQMGMTR